ncbi:MAG: diguanylate cyclase [Synergistaceae bacterium]|nr:diguanylate cyclase [Synergistaceae bacterium]
MSIRGLLVIMVLLASMPSIFILLEMTEDTHCRILTIASQNAAGLADNLATIQKTVDTWLFSMCGLLAEYPGVKSLDLNEVAPLFENLTDKLPMLESALLLDASGGVRASAKRRGSLGLGEGAFRKLFPRIGLEGRAQVGEVISRSLAPARGADGTEQDLTLRCIPYVQPFGSGYVFLLIKVSYLDECIQHFLSSADSISRKWVMGILDTSGSVIVSHASPGFGDEWAEDRWQDVKTSLWESIGQNGERGSFRGLWDDEDCVTGYAKIRLSQAEDGSPMHAVAVVSYFLSDVVKKEKITTLRFLFLSLISVIVGLLFALGVGRRLLVTPIDRLTSANEGFAAGILSSRANIQDGIREIRVLSKSFDDMADALEKQELKRRSENAMIKEQAHRDYLTGTYNRRGGLLELERHIEEAKERAALLSIFFIDVDFFKNINDDYGHNEGDKMLKRMTWLLERQLRSGDVLCRYGGDEFLVILPKCAMAAAEAVWERIEREIQLLNESGKLPYPVSLSHGGAVFDPLAPVSIDELIGEADVKMYEEKAEHKSARKKETGKETRFGNFKRTSVSMR